MPRVSIVIPTYNRADLIGEAIESVLAQGYQDIEVIVADDGSTDNTADVVAQFGQSVIYLACSHRGQPAATRNQGLQIATGEFIAFLDSDDLFLPTKLALQLTAFDEAHPDVGMVYSNGLFFQDSLSCPVGYVQDGLPTPSGQVFAELLCGNFLSPAVILIRRTCLDAVGCFDESAALFAVEDYDLWLRIAAEFQVQYAPGNVAAIRRHGGSISRDVAVLRKRVLTVLNKMDHLYPDLMTQYSNEYHEAYARNHGAVAAAKLRQGNLGAALSHNAQALWHLAHMPGFGLHAFTAWLRRRHLRQNIWA